VVLGCSTPPTAPQHQISALIRTHNTLHPTPQQVYPTHYSYLTALRYLHTMLQRPSYRITWCYHVFHSSHSPQIGDIHGVTYHLPVHNTLMSLITTISYSIALMYHHTIRLLSSYNVPLTPCCSYPPAVPHLTTLISWCYHAIYCSVTAVYYPSYSYILHTTAILQLSQQ
jgi:hypothetical protein